MRTLLLVSLLCSALAQADWALEAPSEVTLISIKNTHVAESHRFERLSGHIRDHGEASLTIDLSSIDSLIPVRDQRMRDMLFETGVYPKAVLSTHINTKVLQEARAGISQTYELEGKLQLHGREADVSVPVLIIATANGRLVVTSLKPVFIHAEQFDLVSGIQQLRDVAKLERIGEVVPVNFTLTFAPQP